MTNLNERYIREEKSSSYEKPNLNLSLFQSTITRMQRDTPIYQLKKFADELKEENNYLNSYI
jgi:hypothetical protein